jgi:hypothetical protein
MPGKMQNRQKVTRVRLDVGTNEDYFLLGIVAAEPDYRLSLQINRKLGISLRHTDPVELKMNSESPTQFTRYACSTGSHDSSFTLVANKSNKDVLLRKLEKIDYFLQVYSPEQEYDAETIAGALRSDDAITAVFVLDPDEIRDKNLQLIIP